MLHFFDKPFRTTLVRRLTAGFALSAALAGCSGAHGDASGANASGPDASASSAPGARAAGRRVMARALASVGLSDDQKAQIRDIMRSARQQNANADPETRRANFKAAFAKIDTVLTPDQRTAFHAKMAELRTEQQSRPSSS